MRRSLTTETLVIVSDHTKSSHEDRWVSDDVIHYTGIGLQGDQSLESAPNKTLAESPANGVIPYLFEVYESGRYLFRGQVALADEPFEELQPDKEDNLRRVWVFALKVLGTDATYKVPGDLVAKKQTRKQKMAKQLSDKDLFARAIYSRKHPFNRKVATTTYEPNVYVAELAKRRANGHCQLCDQPAPFMDNNNVPFLEPHHIIWLSQGGEDAVENIVALCPNCHKKMHTLNLKADRKKLKAEAGKTCCQLTFTGESIFM